MPEPTAPKTRSLLVVDDEELNRDVLSRRLTRAGYQVEMAADAPEALAMIQKQNYELVLLDSMMPGMSGVDLLQLLRGSYSSSELPVIMVTALHESEKVVEALSLGANDYITKPVDFAVALARIQSQLNRKWAEEALRESQERYSLAAKGANDGLWDWDFRAGRIFLSPRWKEMLGYAADDLSAGVDTDPEFWLARVHREDQTRLRRDLAAIRQTHGADEFVHEHRMLHRDGAWRWFLARGTVLRDRQGNAIRMAGSQADVTRDRAFDPLTGLANRVLFLEMLERALEQLRHEEQRVFAVFFMDLDRFKLINDSLGHAAGDKLLKEVARRLDATARTHAPARAGECLVARMGGDEFAILMPGVSNSGQAKAIAAQLQKELYAPVELDGRTAFTSGSIGIALVHPGAADRASEGAAGLLRDADTAMYKAKALGKGVAIVFDQEMRDQALRRLELETDLRFALERGEFEVQYQPKVSLTSGKLVGLEALIRWRHPVRGMIQPMQFILIAEETGLIVPIGLWILRESCERTVVWHAEHPTDPPIEMAVNLSVRQFQQPDLVEQIRRVLAETGLEPRFLQLEVTETVLVDDAEEALRVLWALKELGVGLKIDDFGTGYSSLNYLTNLPFDSIKIDRSFVLNMMSDDTSLEVIKAIIVLAKGLGKEVIAEGIETRAQLERLQLLGCGFGQGFLFSRPVDESVVRQMLKTGIPPH